MADARPIATAAAARAMADQGDRLLNLDCGGAVNQNINGTTYFTFGGAYYQPFYSGSSMIYQVVAKPA